MTDCRSTELYKRVGRQFFAMATACNPGMCLLAFPVIATYGDPPVKEKGNDADEQI